MPALVDDTYLRLLVVPDARAPRDAAPGTAPAGSPLDVDAWDAAVEELRPETPADPQLRRTAAGAAAFVAVLLVIVGFSGPRLSQAALDLSFTAGGLVMALACARTARRCAGPCRRAWWLLALGGVALFVGNALWTWYELVAGRAAPFPSAADVAYLSAPVWVAAGLLSFPGSGRPISRVLSLLDGALIGVSLLFVSWTTVLSPMYHAGPASTGARLVVLAYPVSDVMLAALVLFLSSRGGRGMRVSWYLLGIGWLVYAVADSRYAYQTLMGIFAVGGLVDVGWVAGTLLVALAAVAWPRDGSGPGGYEHRATLGTAALPYLPAAVAIAVCAVDMSRDAVEIGAVLGVLALVATRQLLVLADNLRLNRGLESTVADLRRREDQLRHQALHDALTGLPNRALFGDRLAHALAGLRRSGRPPALLFLDLDDFKAVNDTLGHGYGDRLLAAVGERLRRCVRPGDTVARLGGDEFALLLEEVAGEADAVGVAQRVERCLWRPFVLDGHDVGIRGSIGVVVADHRAGVEELMQRADIAMYVAKEHGKAGHRVFDHTMQAAVVGRLELRQALETAVTAGELVVHYQPLYRLDTETVTGFEALVRWRHPQRGLVPPAAFVPLAEETGLIVPIGRWVLEEACRQARRWQQEQAPGDRPFGMAVNLSVRQLEEGDVVADVARVLEETGLDPATLTLEITESMFGGRPDLLETLRALEALGVSLAIDDFGTGYSSLSQLRHFPVDRLKLDRSFVAALGEGGDDVAIVRLVVELAHLLHLEVVGEGAETVDQVEHLRALGCDTVQGYVFSRPLPADGITRLLDGWRDRTCRPRRAVVR